MGLPVPVDLPTGDRRARPERDRIGRGDGTSCGVAPTLAADDEEQRKRRHPERQARNHPPAEKRPDVRGAQ